MAGIIFILGMIVGALIMLTGYMLGLTAKNEIEKGETDD